MKEEFLAALHFRHACKLFDVSRKIAKDDLDYILEAGRLSPSSMGLEHWRFLVVQTPALKEALQHACMDQPQVGSSSEVVVMLAKKSELQAGSDYVTRLFKRVPLSPQEYEDMLAFYQDFASKTDLVAWSVAQCHIAAANMMTAAAVLGIDSCPIGAFEPDSVRQVLDIDSDRYEIALLLPLGYRKQAQPPKHRLPLEELTTFL